MGIFLFKPLKITTESGAVLFLGQEGEDGLRRIESMGAGDPLPFSICTLEGCGYFDGNNKSNPIIVLEKSAPLVGKSLILRAAKPFFVEGSQDSCELTCTAPILKIENI